MPNLESAYFDTVKDWFTDLDDEDSLFEYRLQAFCNIMEYNSLEVCYFKENNIPFYYMKITMVFEIVIHYNKR